MYEIRCNECGVVGTNPSRSAAESRAQAHLNSTGHGCGIEAVGDA